MLLAKHAPAVHRVATLNETLWRPREIRHPLDVTKHPVKSQVNRGDAIDVIACSLFSQWQVCITERSNKLVSDGSNPAAFRKKIKILRLSCSGAVI